jgi:hypothetical protein
MAKKHEDEAEDKKLFKKMIKQEEKKLVKKMAKGGVTGKAMRAVGRNMARANNQRGG